MTWKVVIHHTEVCMQVIEVAITEVRCYMDKGYGYCVRCPNSKVSNKGAFYEANNGAMHVLIICICKCFYACTSKLLNKMVNMHIKLFQ